MKVIICAVFALLLADTAAGQCSAPYLVEQKFPVSGTEETRWKICWQNQGRHGLVITAAFFRKSPTSPFVRVFWDARLAEILVPYHPGLPRFLDLSDYSQGLVTLNSSHCPSSAGGTLLGSPPVVCREIHDRGLAWMNDGDARRGQEVVLWGTVDSYNYNNVLWWSFRDDGVVEGRYGATALNLPGAEHIAHMHTPVWRLDIDLDGFGGDSVHVASHVESGATATDSSTLVSSETGIEWKADEFTTLHVHDSSLKNAKGQSSMFHLMPLRWGRPRHQEAFAQHDFWVTRYRGTELWAKDLPSYIANAEAVADSDVVVWYMGAVHHLPRAEDGESLKGTFVGAAHLMWTGWVLKPHNLFDRTPLFERR
jgi:Cu2+-containing amine oxidase